MTPEQIALVRLSWRRLVPQSGSVARQFYQRMFELEPSLRQMFRGVDLESQAGQFSAKMDQLLRALENPEDFVVEAAALGRRHAGYGVRSRHYDLLGEALIGALRTGYGPEWTEDLDSAWHDTYALLASVMKRASDRASGSWPTIPVAGPA